MTENNFEVKYVRTREMIKKMAFYMLFSAPINYVFYVLLFVCLVSNAFLFLFYDDPNIPSIIFIVFFIALRIFQYYNYVKTVEKRDKELNGGSNIPICFAASDEGVSSLSLDGGKMTVALSDIKKGNITDDFIIIMTKAKALYFFPKNHFVVGSAHGLVEFLRSKGIKVR